MIIVALGVGGYLVSKNWDTIAGKIDDVKNDTLGAKKQVNKKDIEHAAGNFGKGGGHGEGTHVEGDGTHGARGDGTHGVRGDGTLDEDTHGEVGRTGGMRPSESAEFKKLKLKLVTCLKNN